MVASAFAQPLYKTDAPIRTGVTSSTVNNNRRNPGTESLDLDAILKQLLDIGAPQINSAQSLADSNRGFEGLKTSAAQDRVTSGLSGTTIGASQNAGFERERVAAGNRIREGTQLANIGLDRQFMQDLQPLLEALGQQSAQKAALGFRNSDNNNRNPPPRSSPAGGFSHF